MEITDVRIKKVVTDNKLKAIASITIDGVFVVHDLRVIEGKDGLFVAMPSKKMPSGEFKDLAHPIDQPTREQIEKAVLDALKKVEAEETSKTIE